MEKMGETEFIRHSALDIKQNNRVSSLSKMAETIARPLFMEHHFYPLSGWPSPTMRQGVSVLNDRGALMLWIAQFHCKA